MTAHRAVLTAGLCLLGFVSAAKSAAANEPTPSALGSLRSLEKIQSLYLPVPGMPPVANPPPVAAVARPSAFSASPIPGMPRDGGTNLDGLLRDPRASRVTPAGLRLAEPGWMRKPPSERR